MTVELGKPIAMEKAYASPSAKADAPSARPRRQNQQVS
jgi:hypothetical protein